MTKPILTQEYLKECLHYDPETGIFRWKKEPRPNRPLIGQITGVTDEYGYVRIQIGSKRYRAHRLAFLYMTGAWPTNQVDHRDLNRSNNRWGNLRDATQGQNSSNHPTHKNNKVGLKGVGKKTDGRSKPYAAHISINNKKYHLGYFATPEDAHAAYVAAAETNFSEFARVA